MNYEKYINLGLFQKSFNDFFFFFKDEVERNKLFHISR